MRRQQVKIFQDWTFVVRVNSRKVGKETVGVFELRHFRHQSLFLCGVGKIEPVCQLLNDLFFRAPKSLTVIKHVFGRDGRA